MPGKKEISWNKDLMKTILAARDKLEQLGMRRPSIRSTLYFLMDFETLQKKHYNTLTEKLGEWRDDGLIPFGLFADDGAGAHLRPLTTPEIRARIKALENMIPAKLLPDGTMGLVFTEHIGLVETISGFLDDEVPVVSSQGQLRREHLHSFLSDVVDVAQELGATGIRALALVDWDEAGKFIFEAHRRWMKKVFDIDLKMFAVTSEQLRAIRLPAHEDHQLDGVIGRDPQRFKRELRRTLGMRT